MAYDVNKITKLEALKALAEESKKEFVTKTEADTLIKKAVAESGHARFEEAAEIPSLETAEQNVFYLVPNTDSGTLDIYAKIGDTVKKLADTNIDLTGYVQKEEGKELINTDKITKLDGIAEGATKVEAGETEGTLSINGEEVALYKVATEAEVTEMLQHVFGKENENITEENT